MMLHRGSDVLRSSRPANATPTPCLRRPATSHLEGLHHGPSHQAHRRTISTQAVVVDTGASASPRLPPVDDLSASTSGSSSSATAGTGAVKPSLCPSSSSNMPPPPAGLFVRVRNMVKHFRTPKGVFRAVDGVDVDIEPSSIVALLGPSGSGKTTLLRLVAGLEGPTSGKLMFDDIDATQLSVQDRQIGMVFQSYALFNHKTVAQNIAFGLEVRNVPVDHAKRVAELLALVQLQGLGDRYPRQLSGGQRQRVSLARALASNPRLLLLDEPFGALDAVVRKQLRSGLKEIVRSVGVTTIIVTHDQEEAFDLADKVVVFNRGIVEQQGTPTDIIKNPRTPFIMKFVGETNIVPASSQLVRRMRFATDKSLVMFRPHDAKVFKAPLPEGDPRPTAGAMVVEKFNLGWVIKYALRFDDDVESELHVTRDQDEADYNLALGSRVYVHVRPSNMMAFEPDEIESAPRV